MENGGGIWKYSLTSSGRLIKEKNYSCDRPMYAVKKDGKLTVLLRQPSPSDKNGAVFTIDDDLEKSSEIKTSDGIVPCHLCVDGDDCYLVNYLSGNIVRIGKRTVLHTGHGADIKRQEMPHTHCAILSPDKQYVLCCDLGLDTLFCYDRELNLISKAKISDGYGIRHTVFSKNGKYIYAISEMKPAIHIFEFSRGALKLVNCVEIPCLRENADGAAIRLCADGKLLYVSLRVENSIAVYEVLGKDIRLLQKTSSGGDGPRDFNLTDNHLIVTNEKSENVIVFRLKDGLIDKITDEIKLSSPLCCVV